MFPVMAGKGLPNPSATLKTLSEFLHEAFLHDTDVVDYPLGKGSFHFLFSAT